MRVSSLLSILLRLFFLVVLLGGVAMVLVNYTALNSASVDAWVKEGGVAGPIIFIVFYAMGTVLLVPGPLFLLIGGALYGPVYGTIFCVAAAMMGASMAFLAARFIVSDWLENKIGSRLKRLKVGVEQEGWRFVVFLRLVPVFPAIIINYVLGITRIKFSHYFLASLICKIPIIAAYVYVGHTGLEVVSGTDNLVPKVLIGLALIGLVFFLPRLIINLRRDPPMNIESLKSELDAGGEILLLYVKSTDDYSGELSGISGGMEMSINKLEQRLDELNYYTERPIAIVSNNKKLTSKAADILASNGFAHVHIIKGGVSDLRKQLIPVIGPSQ